MSKTLPSQIKQRTDVTANWETKNPILALGEVGVEVRVDGTIRQKLGDGTTNWTSLPYSTVLPSDLNNYVPLSGGAMTGPLSIRLPNPDTTESTTPSFSAYTAFSPIPEDPTFMMSSTVNISMGYLNISEKGMADIFQNGGEISLISRDRIFFGTYTSFANNLEPTGSCAELGTSYLQLGDINNSSSGIFSMLDERSLEFYHDSRRSSSIGINSADTIRKLHIDTDTLSFTSNNEMLAFEGNPISITQQTPSEYIGTKRSALTVVSKTKTQNSANEPTSLTFEFSDYLYVTRNGYANLLTNGGASVKISNLGIDVSDIDVAADGQVTTSLLVRLSWTEGVKVGNYVDNKFIFLNPNGIYFSQSESGTQATSISSPSSGNILLDYFGNPIKLSGIKTPTEATDAANKGYIDTNLANYLPLTGGNLTGPLSLVDATSYPIDLNSAPTFSFQRTYLKDEGATNPTTKKDKILFNNYGLVYASDPNFLETAGTGVLISNETINVTTTKSAFNNELDSISNDTSISSNNISIVDIVDTNASALDLNVNEISFIEFNTIDGTPSLYSSIAINSSSKSLEILDGKSITLKTPSITFKNGSNPILVHGVADPVEDNDATNKGYVLAQLLSYIPTTGGTIDGTLGVDNSIVYTLADRTAGRDAPIALESSTIFEAASDGSNITNKLKFDAEGLKVYDSNRASVFSVNMYTGRVVFENADSTESTQFRKDSIYVKQPSGVAATPSQLVKYGGDEVEFRAGPLNSETRVAEIKSTVDGALTVKVADSITFSKTSGSDVTLQGVANPVNATDVANKKYVDDKVAASAGLTQAQADARYLNLAGGTLTGQTNFQKGNYAIIVNDASKSFPSISTMSLDSTQVPLNIIAPSVNLSSPTAGQGVLVKGLADPVEGYDAANKAYVDSVAGSIVAYQSILKFEEVDVKTNPITIIKGLPMESTGCRRIINGNMCFYKIYIYLMDTIDITSGNYLRLGLEGAQPFPSDSTSCTFSINDPVNYPSSCATGVGYITSNNPMYFYLPITSNIGVTKVEITAVTNIL